MRYVGRMPEKPDRPGVAASRLEQPSPSRASGASSVSPGWGQGGVAFPDGMLRLCRVLGDRAVRPSREVLQLAILACWSLAHRRFQGGSDAQEPPVEAGPQEMVDG